MDISWSAPAEHAGYTCSNELRYETVPDGVLMLLDCGVCVAPGAATAGMLHLSVGLKAVDQGFGQYELTVTLIVNNRTGEQVSVTVDSISTNIGALSFSPSPLVVADGAIGTMSDSETVPNGTYTISVAVEGVGVATYLSNTAPAEIVI